MKALSVKQPWASMIASREKTIETRTWRTLYRGPLLIVASRSPIINGLPIGVAVCRCELLNVRPMQKADEDAACCDFYDGAYAWVLGNIRVTHYFKVRGKPGLYDVDVTF